MSLPSEPHPDRRGSGPLSLLAEDAFRRVWLTGSLIGTIRWIELLVTGVYVFDATGSPLQVALLTMLRMAPMSLIGAFAGAIAERVSRRRLLAGVLACGIAVSLVQAGLAWSGRLELWHVALGAVVNGMFWAIDMPVRRTMLGELAGPGRTAAAMGLDAATNNATRMLGPGVGGLLLEVTGIHGAFLLGAALYAAGLCLLAGLRDDAPSDLGGRFRIFARVAEGLRFVRGDRGLVGTLAVTIVFNVFAWPATSMVPVIGEERLHLTAFPIGLLMSADGLGALLGAVLASLGARPSGFRGLYLLGVALFALGSLAFAVSPSPGLAGAAQIAAGAGSACFATMQATIVFLSAPAAARPRVMGVLSMCIGTSVLGYVHLGLLAHWLGGPAAVVVTSLEALVALAAAAVIWPEIRPKARFVAR
ncbi:MAG: MFS transporter [Alphaproteobacteria bacterium]|nr:MFS transporter [Alphaproteobacteria bacterium]